MCSVNYEQVMKFYLNKKEEEEELGVKKYFEITNISEGSYISLSNRFRKLKKINEKIYNGKSGDTLYYYAIKSFINEKEHVISYTEDQEYDKKNILDVFTKEEHDKIKSLFNCDYSKNMVLNQKWHLIISYMFYQLLNVKLDKGKIEKKWNVSWAFISSNSNLNSMQEPFNKFDYYTSSQCPELKLWMAEISGCNENIEDFYADIEKFVEIEWKNFIEKKIAKKEYNRRVCTKISELCPWEKIAKKIIEEYPLPKDNEENK